MKKQRFFILAIALPLLSACQGAPPLATRPASTNTATEPSAAPPSATPRPAPSATPLATPTLPSPTATASPTPPELRRLAEPGCCTQPFWSPDSSQIWYIDRPDQRPARVWGVPIVGNTARAPVIDRVAYFSPDALLLLYLDNGQTTIERRSDGQRWTIPNGGRAVTFSPDSKQILWQVSPLAAGFFDRVPADLWLAGVDGIGARRLLTIYGGGLAGWFPDGSRLLLSGKRSLDEADRALFTYDLQTGATVELMRGQRLQGISLSPDGRWAALMNTFSGDPASDGLWLVSTDGRTRRKADIFGGFAWRDASHLLVIPLEREQGNHVIWQIDAATGASRRLTDPKSTPLSIADGDWRISPDGRWLAFVASADSAIWVLRLP